VVAEPVTPLFGAMTIWYVPADPSVFPLNVTEVVEDADVNVLPSGFSRYAVNLPPEKLGVICTLTVCPAVPLKLSPISDVVLIVLMTGVPKLIVPLVVWLMSDVVAEPVTPLLGTITIW